MHSHHLERMFTVLQLPRRFSSVDFTLGLSRVCSETTSEFNIHVRSWVSFSIYVVSTCCLKIETNLVIMKSIHGEKDVQIVHANDFKFWSPSIIIMSKKRKYISRVASSHKSPQRKAKDNSSRAVPDELCMIIYGCFACSTETPHIFMWGSFTGSISSVRQQSEVVLYTVRQCVIA